MHNSLASESNTYAHKKSGIHLQASGHEFEIFTRMYFHRGLALMPAVGNYWETKTRHTPLAEMTARNRFQKLAFHVHFKDNLQVTDSEKLNVV